MAGSAREFFETLEARAGDSSKAAGLNATYLFDIDGAGKWIVRVENGQVGVQERDLSRDGLDPPGRVARPYQQVDAVAVPHEPPRQVGPDEARTASDQHSLHLGPNPPRSLGRLATAISGGLAEARRIKAVRSAGSGLLSPGASLGARRIRGGL